jgi:hypothetical protein
VLRDHSSDPDAVAEHFRFTGKPTATVYVRDILEDKKNPGDWKTGANSVSASVSHEVVELFVDPLSMNYVDGLDDYIYALEIADPTQEDVYEIGRVAVSNFTYRPYWNPWAKPGRGVRLDHLGLITRPFEVRKGGYLVRYRASDTAHAIDGRAFPIRKRLVKEQKPNGRTRRRLEQLVKLSDGAVKLPLLGGTIPAVIDRYQDAHDRRDVETALATFTPRAKVADDGHDYRGRNEIRDWLARASTKFTYTRTLTGAGALDANTWLVTNHLAGDFPGGVVDLRYRFVLTGDLISSLEIAP